MKYLIVNGDDLGASSGINRGIAEAYKQGILTSASLMVDMPAAEQAARLRREIPDLNIGLHACLTSESGVLLVDPDDPGACRAELRRQYRRFLELVRQPPTHLDAHHNIHRDPRLLPLFKELAAEQALPLREHSPARYVSCFYGQWDGETHLEQVSVGSLLGMLETEAGLGITELGCHPGYPDPDFESEYSVEREAELRTLCDPRIRARIDELGIRLIGFRDIARVTG